MVFGFGSPVVFPAKSVEKLFEKFATINMFHAAHAGDEAFNITLAISAKFVCGAITIIAGAFTRNDKTRIDDSADEGYAFVDGLFILFFGMESEAEFAKKKLTNDLDITEELGALAFGNDNEEIINVATVMRIAEVKANETVKLVKEDIRE